jgi:hypothetical protein
MLVNWVQIDMCKTLKTIKVHHQKEINYKIFPFFYAIENGQSLFLNFKLYLI